MGQSYRELIAGLKAMDFVTMSSALAAEGQARFSANEFHYFLGRARGSLGEVKTQLMIA